MLELRGETVLPGDGRTIDDGAVVVGDDDIVVVGAAGDLDPVPGDHVVDLPGTKSRGR